MTHPDPRAGIHRLIEILCDFWSSDQGALAWLQGVGAGDADFEESIRARNERRRHALGVLVDRLAQRSDVAPERMKDVTDLLFALTSFPVFAGLLIGRETHAACALIQAAADQIMGIS